MNRKTVIALLVAVGISGLFGAGCAPTDSRLREIADNNHAILLTDKDGNQYIATHHGGDVWVLQPVK